MYKSTIEKIIAIYNRSGLSISKFASIINKDRRTLTSWIDKTVTKEPSTDVKQKISQFFRYPNRIWDEECYGLEFDELLEKIPQEEIRIIDQGYEGGLRYIIDKEKENRFVIHPQFPGPAYRDRVVPTPYKKSISQEAEMLKKKRYQQIIAYDFESIEWYSIDSLLRFAFSPIGNFYTKDQKLEILDLIYDTFHDNYNKSLYLFDSHSTKVYGMSTAYISMNAKRNFMFFKTPIDSLIVEIQNKKLIQRFHKYFTSASQAPNHLSSTEITNVLQILKEAIKHQKGLIEFYKDIESQTNYSKLFLNNISLDLHPIINRA
jgi:hypothetical protein